MDEAVQIAHDAIFFNHGQNCCAGSRTFVQAGIYDKFVAKAKAKADGRTVGNPWTDVDQGPQVCKVYNGLGLKKCAHNLYTDCKFRNYF